MSTPSPRECGVLIRLAFRQAYDALSLLREKALLQPYLAVLYSSIDAAAWLSSDHGGDVQRSDFESWVARYVLPGSGLKCTPTDLYGARCGVLHSFSAYSRLHREGKARAVSYAWGSANVSELEELMGRWDPDNSVAVHLDDLTNAFFKGLEKSLRDVESRTDAGDWLVDRASHLFSALDRSAIETALRHHRANG